MKRTFGLLLGLAAAASLPVLLSGCGANSSGAPPVIAAMVGQRADESTLRSGRTLFANRCIECHSLPRIAEHSAAAWPSLVGKMSGRAGLSAREREAILAYILAVHG